MAMAMGREVRIVKSRALVVGSGCAGLNCADWLADLGVQTVLLTEGMNLGTSRNAGSDKQTYYKLSLSGEKADCPADMARDLCSAGMHGDEAYVEAANSAACFLKLARLGVPFPTNRMGEYVGYQTDHDERGRATSAGPLTSRFMTEKLEASVKSKGVAIEDGYMAVKVIVKDGRAAGVVAVGEKDVLLVLAPHVVLATGGPARLYEYSAFPPQQLGMSSLAIDAGARMANLHQWQYGLATVKFRWNVSGTYQQVMPRFVSVGEDGERELLPDRPDARFLKGYQWPFDVRKAQGSSMVDLAVHQENEKGRRVYLDFTRNPSGLEKMGEEARSYLEKSGADQPTPYERLMHMNPGAAKLYADHDMDLSREMAEIRVCAQHHNGGAAVNVDGETSVPGLYAAGECAGTFGAYRPGGSALNATQVTSMRAAQHIAMSPWKESAVEPENCLEDIREALMVPVENRETEFRREMSACGAHLRNLERLKALSEAQNMPLRPLQPGDDYKALFGAKDAMCTRKAVISAMLAAAEIYGSDGSGMVLEEDGSYRPHRDPGNFVLETDSDFITRPVEARPLPRTDQWFENVWRDYRERMRLA